jgi:DNA-binding response OmpR family regulator
MRSRARPADHPGMPHPAEGAAAAPRVLVIEDTPDTRELIVGVLRGQGLDVDSVGDGAAGMDRVASWGPDVVVLDIGLPGMDGVEVCRRLRAISEAYVVMLTGRSDEIDKVVGLSVGADDYVTKPFSSRELAARVQAMLRRARPGTAPSALRRLGGLTIDSAGHEVLLDGAAVELTRREFGLLDVLSAEPNVAFTRAQLLERVWGASWFGDDHLVDVHISNLRRKIEPDPKAPRYIRTVRGVGYRMGQG